MAWWDRFKKETIVVHQGDGHNKFWAAQLDTNTHTVSVRWGRIGTKGQSQTKGFGSEYQAANFIDSKLSEKRRKGYVSTYDGKPIDDAKLEELFIEAAIVGTSNKCHAMQWVEITQDDGTRIAFEKIDQARLMDPNCNPALVVEIETRKLYCGVDKFSILFTPDAAYFSNPLGGKGMMSPNFIVKSQRVTSSHEAAELTQKVEEAIGRKLS